MFRTIYALFLLVSLSLTQPSVAQQSKAPHPAPGSPEDLVQQGEKLSHDGEQDEALALYRQALDKAPNLYEAHLETGIALDLKGDYPAAQEHFTKAIEAAPADLRPQALRSMAFSYAFEGNAGKAADYEVQLFTGRTSRSEWIPAAETCNELARIYLESGDSRGALKWYKMGYETASRKTDMSDAEKNLWLFRWESAQARIAARTGQASEAQRHVAAAKAALDKANSPDQARFYPYLTGYVAFYSGDNKTAIAELEKADRRDPFILVLLGQAFEKSGDQTRANDYYRMVLEINTHNPTNAFARPLAKKKLGLGT